MEILLFILIGFVGLCIGSFLGVIVFRLDVKEGILTGRSECSICHEGLKWYDLIPIVSFVFLGGRCRYCKKKLPFVYPAIELAVSGSLVLYFAVRGFNFGISTAYELIILLIFLTLIFFDYLFYILPDKIVFSGIGIAALYGLLWGRNDVVGGLIMGMGLATFFGIIYVMSHGEWIGFGDIKLVFLVGLVLGFPVALLSMTASVWLGALWGMGMMAFGRAGLKTALPFGSFIGASAVLFIIFYKQLSIFFYGL